MSEYGADPTIDLDRAQHIARGYAYAPLSHLHVDAYTQPDGTRTLHLVDRHTRSSLWLHLDPLEAPY